MDTTAASPRLARFTPVETKKGTTPRACTATTAKDGALARAQPRWLRQSVSPHEAEDLRVAILERAAREAAASTEQRLVSRVQRLLPVGSGSIREGLSDLATAALVVAHGPAEMGPRSNFLEHAETVTGAFRCAARGLARLQREVDDRVASMIQRAAQLVGLVIGMGPLRSEAWSRSSDEIDAFSGALRELAGLMGAELVEWGVTCSALSASAGGQTCGADGPEILVGLRGPALGLDGASLTAIGVRSSTGVRAWTGRLGGALGSLLDVRDILLVRWARDLDRAGRALRDALNQPQSDPTARDLDDRPGGDLISGTGAADLAIAIAGPRAIAAGRVGAASPGDNARSLADRLEAGVPELGGATLAGFVEAIQEAVAERLQAVARGLTCHVLRDTRLPERGQDAS